MRSVITEVDVNLFFDSQAERDHQYTARDTVPDYTVFVREYTVQSDAAKRALDWLPDQAYGAGAAETFDFFPATTLHPSPVFVFLHGGYWRALSKNESAFMVPLLHKHGIATVALDYALAPDVTLETIVAQCRSAIAHLVREHHRYHIDPRRIFIGGSSAGAHLAAMLLAPGWQVEHGLTRDVIAGAILLSGIYDLAPLCDTHINDWLQLTSERAHAMSPIHHLPDYPCHILCSVGALERQGFHRQTQAYLNALHAHGRQAHYLEDFGRHHFNLPLDLMEEDSLLAQALVSMLGR